MVFVTQAQAAWSGSCERCGAALGKRCVRLTDGEPARSPHKERAQQYRALSGAGKKRVASRLKREHVEAVRGKRKQKRTIAKQRKMKTWEIATWAGACPGCSQPRGVPCGEGVACRERRQLLRRGERRFFKALRRARRAARDQAVAEEAQQKEELRRVPLLRKAGSVVAEEPLELPRLKKGC